MELAPDSVSQTADRQQIPLRQEPERLVTINVLSRGNLCVNLTRHDQ
jgi:hypothetical protein